MHTAIALVITILEWQLWHEFPWSVACDSAVLTLQTCEQLQCAMYNGTQTTVHVDSPGSMVNDMFGTYEE